MAVLFSVLFLQEWDRQEFSSSLERLQSGVERSTTQAGRTYHGVKVADSTGLQVGGF